MKVYTVLLSIGVLVYITSVVQACNTCTQKKCKWNNWSKWSPCSAKCGKGGVTTRKRTHDTCGAESCVGIKSESKQCNIGCPYGGKPSIGRCTCSGYSGTCCEKDVNECLMKPCKNKGVCTNTKGSFKCTCTADFTGDTCQKQINRCVGKICNKGSCRDYKIGYKCLCGQFYTGKHCETCLPRNCITQNWSEWSSCTHKCGNQGKRTRERKVVIKEFCGGDPCPSKEVELCNQFCPHPSRLYKDRCRCYRGMSGECCDIDVNECKNAKVCNGNGVCTNTIGSYSCKCKVGYYGRTCNLNYCKSNSCKNGGECTAHSSGFECKCSDKFVGKTCEIDVDECAENPKLCRYGGTCLNTIGGFTCKCTSEWSGSICQYDVNECNESPCKNGGRCKNHMFGFTCKCLQGTNGDLCEQVNDACVSNPCKHGTCQKTDSGYTCKCEYGYTGINCDSCEPKDCVVEWGDWSRCTKECGVGGIQVKKRIIVEQATCGGKCEGDNLMRRYCNQVCPNGATMHTGGCKCNPGYTGKCCIQDVNECKNVNICGSNAICTNTIGSYTCKCKKGFYGNKCEKNYCDGACKNGATCIGLENGYKCECTQFYQGITCDEVVDLCKSTKPCLNGGTCKNNADGGYMCKCPYMYMGKQCENKIHHCDSSPCKNQGICIPNPNDDGGFKCTCPDGYSGPLCKKICKEGDYVSSCLIDNPCLSNPCQNNARCKTNANGLMCVCTGKFYGSLCQYVLMPGCNLRAVEGQLDKYQSGVHIMSCAIGTVFKASTCGCGFA